MPTDAGSHDQDGEQDTNANAAINPDENADANTQAGADAESDADADADADADYDSDDFIDDEDADIMPAPNRRKKRGGKRVPNKNATKKTPKRGPNKKGPRKLTKKSRAGGWIRCVKLLREPTEQDKIGFTSNAISNRKKPNDGKAQDDSDSAFDTDDEDLEELEADDDTMDRIRRTGNSKGKKQRIPAQWKTSMHLTQFIFNLVHSCGTKGISTMVWRSDTQFSAPKLIYLGSDGSCLGPPLETSSRRIAGQVNRRLAGFSACTSAASVCSPRYILSG